MKKTYRAIMSDELEKWKELSEQRKKETCVNRYKSLNEFTNITKMIDLVLLNRLLFVSVHRHFRYRMEDRCARVCAIKRETEKITKIRKFNGQTRYSAVWIKLFHFFEQFASFFFKMNWHCDFNCIAQFWLNFFSYWI